MAVKRHHPRALLAGGAILVVNSAYLAADGSPHVFYFFNLVLHMALGIALLWPFLRWWAKTKGRPAARLGGASLLLSAAGGVLLMAYGNLTPMRPLLLAHIALAVAGVLILASQARRGRTPLVAAILMLAALPLAVESYRRSHPDPRDSIVNPAAPLTMADEAMGGESGPFFPSSVHTSDGGYVPGDLHLKPESCGGSGCHPDVLEQWQASAHHFSSFNNQWYRKSIEYVQEISGGPTASKWCGGCHDPALLQTGLMDRPIAEVVDRPEAQAGLTCTSCHLISAVRSSMGNGDYEIAVPPLHNLAASDNPILKASHDFLVKVDPEPHRRTFMRPFYRGSDSPEYCSSCHKVHLDVPVNGYRWIRGFNEYDNWQASGVSGFGARSFYYPPSPQVCADCHMPLVPSDDAANKDGRVRSHRFPGANTALAVANEDQEQLQAVTHFLQAGQVSVDLFAMTRLAPEAEGEGLALEGPSLATTFAVGEEQGMAVGAGGLQTGPAAPVLAPLDRFPARVKRGENLRLDVVVRTRGVGHFFPGGTVDAYDCWVELKATDETGRVLFWSGAADEESPVDPSAHFYRSLMIDAHGNPIDKRNASYTRAVVYVRLIPPGAADTVRFRLEVPRDAGDSITVETRLNYRKFAWDLTRFSYAGVPDPAQEGATFGSDFDDRRFVYTGDLSQVSGKLKEIPRVPIVVMSEDRVVLAVVDDDEILEHGPVPGGQSADRERWNDYGIGLLRQGDLRAARHAFEQVTRLQPEYVDGWVNLGRVALAEGDLDAAEQVLDRALEIEPDLARGHFFAGLKAKELGEYDLALEHLDQVVEQYPRDRVVLNQRARVRFLRREYQLAIEEAREVHAIDPEDLMAHYTLMLAYRGIGDLESSQRHQALYQRFKADEASQILTGEYLKDHPHDNNERQPIHEHRDGDRALMTARQASAGAPIHRDPVAGR